MIITGRLKEKNLFLDTWSTGSIFKGPSSMDRAQRTELETELETELGTKIQMYVRLWVDNLR